MIKKLLVFVTLLMTYGAMAQKEISQDLDKFTEIKAFDRIFVRLQKSNVNKIVITGEDRDDVVVSEKNGLLKIRMELENQFDGDDINATVYYTETLSLIDANENAKITSEESISAPILKVAAQEGGKITLAIQSDQLEVKATSGGEIALTGTAKSQDVLSNAGGKVLNEKLQTVTTKVTVNAGGRADIKAADKVIAKVRAGGNITIYGNPKEVEKNKVFGGSIKIIE